MTEKSAEHLQQQIDSANSYIEELQTKVAFQEHTIEALNDALAGREKQLDDIAFKVRHGVDRVKSIEPSNIAKQSEETPPPHY